MKTCTLCKIPKEDYDFYPDRRLKSGLKSSCRQCQMSRRSPEQNRLNTKKYRLKLRMDALEYYSKGKPKCNCCGESTLQFLCIDHINNDGNKHRRDIGYTGGDSVIKWLRKNDYPEGFQVLCYNCNMAKSFYAACPHTTLH